MSIQNQLSSDIAVALLAGKDKDPERLNELKEVVLKVHSILQEITTGADSERIRKRAASAGDRTQPED